MKITRQSSAKHQRKRKLFMQRAVARFLLLAIALLYSMNGIYLRKVYAGMGYGADNEATDIWQWKLMRSKSDFPTSDTPVLICFGQYFVPGGTSDRSGDRSSGFYVNMLNTDDWTYNSMGPAGDVDVFLTRGMLPCHYMGKWDDNDGGRYYFKPNNDTGRYIEHIDKNAFESGCDNWWYETLSGCHSDENSYGSGDVYWMFRVTEYGDGRFGFYAPNTGCDFRFCDDFCGDHRFGIGYRTSGNDHCKCILYKGTKVCDAENLATKGLSTYTVKSGEVMTVKDVAYLSKSRKLVIEDGAVFIVNGRFICNGEIENHGTMIVDSGGYIFQLSSEWWNGVYNCQGGDLIIRNGGTASFRKLHGTGGNYINYGLLNAICVDMTSPLIDNKSTGYVVFGAGPSQYYTQNGSNYNDSYGGCRNSLAYYLWNEYFFLGKPDKVKIQGSYRLINRHADHFQVWYFSGHGTDYSFTSASVEGNSIKTKEWWFVWYDSYRIG